MRKTILMLATAGALVAGMASCKKRPMPKEAIKQTIDVSLKENESYTFSLPKNLRDDPYEVVIQAKHYNISEVGSNTSGERVYLYTPTAGYTGSDQVVLSNDQEREEGKDHPAGPPKGGPKKGDCNGEEEDHYIITINFQVNRVDNATDGI